MGFFDRLFKKKPIKVISNEAKSVTIEQQKTSVSGMVQDPVVKETKVESTNREYVEQEPIGKLSYIDFGKPVGELGCFLNYRKYKITGIGDGGRKRSEICTGYDEQHALEKATSRGLLPPFETKIIEFELPTERQLEYLKNLGVVIPEGVTKTDASYMIDRVVEEFDSFDAPKPSLVALALGLKTEFSAFIGVVPA